MKKTLMITALLLLTFSCGENAQTNTEPGTRVEEDVREVETKNEENKTKPQFIENANLARLWYDELEKISREEERFSVEKEYQENRHVPGRTDTIILLTSADTKMRIHTTKGCMLWCRLKLEMKILSSRI